MVEGFQTLVGGITQMTQMRNDVVASAPLVSAFPFIYHDPLLYSLYCLNRHITKAPNRFARLRGFVRNDQKIRRVLPSTHQGKRSTILHYG